MSLSEKQKQQIIEEERFRAEIRKQQTSKTEKNKIVAGLFGIFLGGIGIHKFYLGKVGQGILYLLFCWTFIPMIVGFFEGIYYLAISDDKFNSIYR